MAPAIAHALLFASLALGGENGSGLTLIDAVTRAIASSPEVSLARETLAWKRAQVRIDKGEQDIRLSTDVSLERNDMPLTPYSQKIYKKGAEDIGILTTTLSAQKQFNNGVTLTPSLSLKREDDSMLDSPPDNYGVVSFELSIPLLDLWSTGILGKKEKDSEIDLRATRMDLAATVSRNAASAAMAFWSALGSKETLRLDREAEKDARRFLTEMTVLVEKDAYPAASLDQVRADLDAKAVRRISTEQAYYAALQTLALEMGMAIETLGALADVKGEFPAVEPVDLDIGALIRHAEEHRPDLAAERMRERYYAQLVADARGEMLPDLDLNLGAGYNGLDETSSSAGYFRSLSENVPGPSYNIGLSVSRPLGNNVAAGKWQQARINLNKEKILIQTLRRHIASEVLTAYQGCLGNRLAVEHQADAVEKYGSALEKKTIMFRRRMATLSDQLDARDDYHESLKALVVRRKAYADALVQLRLASGSLVRQTGSAFEIDTRGLMSPDTEKCFSQ